MTKEDEFLHKLCDERMAQADLSALQAENAALQAELLALKSENAELVAQNTKFQQRIADLESAALKRLPEPPPE